MKYLIGMVMTVLMSGSALATGDVTVDDVKKLARAGISEETILAFLKANPPSFRPTAQDIVDLKEAGVTPKVLVYLLEPKGGAHTHASTPASATASRETIRPVYVYSTPSAYDYAWPRYGYWTYYPHYYFGGYGYGSHYGYGHHGYGHRLGGWHHGGGHSYGHSGHHGGGHGHR